MIESVIFDPEKETLEEFAARLNTEIDSQIDSIVDPKRKAATWNLITKIRLEQGKLKNPLSRAQVAYNRMMDGFNELNNELQDFSGGE